MTDSQIHDRLHSAVDTTTAPPGLAQLAMRGGRARRRRRYAAGTLVAALAVTAGAAFLPDETPLARDGQAASATASGAEAMTWARTLPEGPVPALPYFGEGGLHAGDQIVPLPVGVNETIAPKVVAGGWLVLVGQDEKDLAYAVLGVDGSLRNLPIETYDNGLGDTRTAVSADGRQVALGRWVVDLETMRLTDLPHAPASDDQDGYSTAIRIVGFADDDLVYVGAPFSEGLGTTYLRADDGTTTAVDPPGDSYIPDGSPADVAISFDYSRPPAVCLTTYRLSDSSWVERSTQCLGNDLEVGATSPDGRALLVREHGDDRRGVMDLLDGGLAYFGIPGGLQGQAVWEDDDNFLLALADPTGDGATDAFDQTVQVVRCSVSTRQCQRAGEEQHLTISTDGMDTNGVRFADQ